MNIHIQEINNTPVAFILSSSVVLNNVEEAVDLLGNVIHKGVYTMILNEPQITPSFFDLKTGVAGEILQKFSNYNVRLAIVGDFSKYDSSNLKAFISESNTAGKVVFVPSVEEAIAMLSK